MTDQKWTPEPEFSVIAMEDTLVLDSSCEDGHKYITIGHIPELYEHGDGECGSMSVSRAERVVVLWNLFRNIPDPAGYVEAVAKLVRFTEVYAYEPRECECAHHGDGFKCGRCAKVDILAPFRSALPPTPTTTERSTT